MVENATPIKFAYNNGGSFIEYTVTGSAYYLEDVKISEKPAIWNPPKCAPKET